MVKLTAANPAPAEVSELQIIKWALTLAPQTRQTITFGFTVEYPRTLTVTGLPT